MNVIQQNILSKFHDGECCHFTKYEYLEETIDKISKGDKPCVLISGNSDFTHTQRMVDYVASSVPLVKKWFAQNLDAEHEIAEAIPLGITNTVECKRGEKHGVKRVDKKHVDKLKYMKGTNGTPIENVYANFNVNTSPGRRIPVAKICQNSSHINSQIGPTLTLDEYFDNCRRHKMTVCPEGNGFDTHRFWETLYVNRVPITLRIKAMNHFKSLPVVWLDEWEQLEDLDFLTGEYDKVKDNNKDMAYLNYWEEKIEGLITKIKQEEVYE
jgi:hypothetical protein